METIIQTLNEWFGYISNIAIGGGAVFVVLLTRTVVAMLKGNAFGEKIVGMTVNKMKELLSNDSPERAEFLNLLEKQPEFQKIMGQASEFINFQQLELEKQILDIETKLTSGILEKPQFEKYKELLVKLQEQLSHYAE